MVWVPALGCLCPVHGQRPCLRCVRDGIVRCCKEGTGLLPWNFFWQICFQNLAFWCRPTRAENVTQQANRMKCVWPACRGTWDLQLGHRSWPWVATVQMVETIFKIKASNTAVKYSYSITSMISLQLRLID